MQSFVVLAIGVHLMCLKGEGAIVLANLDAVVLELASSIRKAAEVHLCARDIGKT